MSTLKTMVKKIFYIVIVIIGVYLIINLGSNIANLWQRQEEVGRTRQGLETLKKENKDLKAQSEYFQTPEFLEREAREKLGLVRPGEKQVIIEEGLLASMQAQPNASVSGQGWSINWEKWWKLFF